MILLFCFIGANFLPCRNDEWGRFLFLQLLGVFISDSLFASQRNIDWMLVLFQLPQRNVVFECSSMPYQRGYFVKTLLRVLQIKQSSCGIQEYHVEHLRLNFFNVCGQTIRLIDNRKIDKKDYIIQRNCVHYFWEWSLQ